MLSLLSQTRGGFCKGGLVRRGGSSFQQGLAAEKFVVHFRFFQVRFGRATIAGQLRYYSLFRFPLNLFHVLPKRSGCGLGRFQSGLAK